MIYDISPLLGEDTPVWPGDVPLTRHWQCQLEKGDNIDLSSLQTTVHVGAHADAPSHFSSGGQTIDEVDLLPYIGPCQVIEITGKVMIGPDDFHRCHVNSCSRLLIKTGSFSKENFTSFSAINIEGMAYLGELGIVLLGIDTPSVDPFESKSLCAHKEMLRHGIRNLEGLDLSLIEPGVYELIALPLPLKGFDASPVRAILRAQ